MSVDLRGAADLHCHFGPDARRERSVDGLEAAREALAAGHRALVLKCHEMPSVQIAWAAREAAPGLEVFGGICCDLEVGGINPVAVEMTLRLGGRIVWLPTSSSRQDVRTGLSPWAGNGVSVLDDDGRLTEDALQVMALVQEHGAVLATGHISAEEHFAVAREFGRRGTVLVTHAGAEPAGPDLTPAQCAELVALGAHVELCAISCMGMHATKSIAQQVGYIEAVGVGSVVLATDFGQAANAHPVDGLRTYADQLHAEGVPEADLRRMACTNPCRLLGLDG